MISVRDLDNRGFQARIAAMEDECQQNNRRIAHLTEVRDQKEQHIGDAHQRINKEQLLLGQLRGQNA